MIEVRCSCRALLSVRDDQVGGKLVCPSCGNPFTVEPGPPGSVDVEAILKLDRPARHRPALRPAMETIGVPLSEQMPFEPRCAPWVEQRFERLEAENKALRRTLSYHRINSAVVATCLGLSVILLVFTGNHAQAHKVPTPARAPATAAELPRTVVEAEDFVVRDSSGKVRVRLGRLPHPTAEAGEQFGLFLYSEGSVPRASLASVSVPGAVDGRARLMFEDAEARCRLVVAGESPGAGVLLFGRDGKPLAVEQTAPVR